jgi:hypothetical protein
MELGAALPLSLILTLSMANARVRMLVGLSIAGGLAAVFWVPPRWRLPPRESLPAPLLSMPHKRTFP